MKKYIVYAILVIAIIGALAGMGLQIKILNKHLQQSVANEKAWISENSELKSSNQAFQLSINQLSYYNDSVSQKLLSMKEELKIKDKNLKSMQLLLEHYSKTDTIYLKDTIVIEKETQVILDTCIQDYWNKTCVYLQYPNILALSHEYNNEKYVMIDSRKEPIKPRKCKIGNWFAKKHTVIEVTVIDKNPNVQTPKQRFVEIIK